LHLDFNRLKWVTIAFELNDKHYADEPKHAALGKCGKHAVKQVSGKEEERAYWELEEWDILCDADSEGGKDESAIP
jgi:hypothetical protein